MSLNLLKFGSVLFSPLARHWKKVRNLFLPISSMLNRTMFFKASSCLTLRSWSSSSDADETGDANGGKGIGEGDPLGLNTGAVIIDDEDGVVDDEGVCRCKGDGSCVGTDVDF